MSDASAGAKPLRAGVVGVGSLGQHHARVYTQIPGVSLVGVVDANEQRAKEVAKRHHCQAYTDPQALLGQVDLVSIVVPTWLHFSVTRPFLQQGVHVLLEKPMTRTLEEADELVALAQQSGSVFQIGHIERFNEAFQELKRFLTAPGFVEVHRLGPFSQRNTDIGVTLDLMIHDLDILLHLVNSPVARVEGTGVQILSDYEDIANARLTFANGCVANVTASRVTLEAQRKIRIFSPGSYISLDYQKQEMTIYRLKPGAAPNDQNLMHLIERERLTFGKREPLMLELSAFVDSVRLGQVPEVTGEVGRQALAVALDITAQIRKQNFYARA
ncbi:MAG: Gfo/Idh/MocA family oxidoreductase [candidate division FCPU426 bacterium]